MSDCYGELYRLAKIEYDEVTPGEYWETTFPIGRASIEREGGKGPFVLYYDYVEQDHDYHDKEEFESLEEAQARLEELYLNYVSNFLEKA